jgi:hypothetical protein
MSDLRNKGLNSEGGKEIREKWWQWNLHLSFRHLLELMTVSWGLLWCKIYGSIPEEAPNGQNWTVWTTE